MYRIYWTAIVNGKIVEGSTDVEHFNLMQELDLLVTLEFTVKQVLQIAVFQDQLP